MQEQREILERTSLLKDDGSLNAIGWSRRCIIDYNKDCIPKKLRWRKKEWDFYQCSDGEMMVQVTFANISVGAAATATVVNLRTGETHSQGAVIPFTFNSYALTSKDAESESDFVFDDGKIYLRFEVKKEYRNLVFIGGKGKKRIEIDLVCHHIENNESITIVTPFKLQNRFFMTTKYNCMRTEGSVTVGDKTYTYDPDKTYSVLDWGRGVWPHKNYWYWGNGATVIDGKVFGFEITYGIGIEDNATETCLFYDGKAHKIGVVKVKVPPKKNGYMKDWEFVSEDGRFNLTMTPYYDNAGGMIALGIIGMKSHQVHGLFNGTVKLDDGTVLEVKDMYAFCEYVENRW